MIIIVTVRHIDHRHAYLDILLGKVAFVKIEYEFTGT